MSPHLQRFAKRNLLKFLSSFILFTFCFQHCVFSQESLAPVFSQQANEIGLDTATPPEVSPAGRQEDPSNRFWLASPLTKIEEKHPDFSAERYDLEEALDHLRPEFAAAVLVKDLTLSGIKKLLKLPIETGILVLHGEIILFTSGSEDEIGILPAVKKLLQEADFISHTHPGIYSAEGPSGQDLNEAVAVPRHEYVLTAHGAYAYNQEGLLNNGTPFSHQEYLEALQQALTASRENQNQIAARQALNHFIAGQDRYNKASEDEKSVFRMGGTISYTSSLKAANVTTLPGTPDPLIMTGSTSATQISLLSGPRFQVNYDVTASGSYSGMTVSFDNLSTSVKETQNISGLSSIVLGLTGTANAVKMEFVDINGKKDVFTLTGVSSAAERFWKINISSIASTVNKSKITGIHLYVDQSTTASNKRTGAVTIRTYGLDTNPPAVPVITSQVPQTTNQSTLTLTGTKEANTSVWINGVQAVASNASTTWSTVLNLSTEGNNSFSVQTKNTLGKLSAVTSVSTIKDTIQPVISDISVAENAALEIPFLVLTYKVTDRGVTTEKSVEWSLTEGQNQILLNEIDAAGNVTQVLRHAVYQSLESSLTPEQRALRQNLIETNSSFFREGVGVDAATGFPYDWLKPIGNMTGFYTQPTSIGFYLQFLGDVITRQITLPDLTRDQAVAAALKTINSLLQAQEQIGWNGLFSWIELEGGMHSQSPIIAFGDNANLSHSVAVFIGALEAANTHKTFAAEIRNKAVLFLQNQTAGYTQFYDSGAQRFHLVYDRNQGGFHPEHIDRLGSEFRASIAFIIENYNLPRAAWDNLVVTTRYYTTEDGRTIQSLSPFEGSAFQLFWPLLRAPEHELAKMSEALQNGLTIFSDFKRRYDMPGFVSAASLPGGGYDGYLGIRYLQENSTPVREDLASVYALGSAYLLNPAFVLDELKQIREDFPGLTGPYGFYDSMDLQGNHSDDFLAIDQGSFIVGLAGNGPRAFETYMENRNLMQGYNALYESLNLNLEEVTVDTLGTPLTAAEKLTWTADSQNLYEAGYSYNAAGDGQITASEVSDGIIHYEGNSASGWIGGWVNPVFNPSAYRYMTLEVKNSTAASSSFRLEIKNGSNLLLNLPVIQLGSGSGWQKIQFFMPADLPTIDFIAISSVTSGFDIRGLYFTDRPLVVGNFPPSIELLSENIVQTENYELTYKINEEVYSEQMTLNAGTNMIERIFRDNWGRTFSHTFSIQVGAAKTLMNFSNISQGFFWDVDGTQIYQRLNVSGIAGTPDSTAMQVNYTKMPEREYSFFAFQPFQNGTANNFSGNTTFAFRLQNLSPAPMTLLVKLDFNGSSQTYEQQISIPAASGQWGDIVIDLSSIPQALLADVRNIMFFSAPGSSSAQGQFLMDDLRLS